jgi:hypothetical protein
MQLGVALCRAAALAAGTVVALAGWVGAPPPARTHSIEAYFEQRSYAPGASAHLVVASRHAPLTLDILQLGAEYVPTAEHGYDGVRRAGPVALGAGARRLSIRIGSWPSGLYVARLRRATGAVTYAPFVVRPHRPGEHRVAIVLPTNTWQAYNFRDADGDGTGDTWYADSWTTTSVDLSRGYLGSGLPPHFAGYDAAFVLWLGRTQKEVDFFADDDLERISGDRLARAYDLVVFPGHEEYVTTRAYGAIERFRNLGGNLAFLSANNLYYRVVRRGDTIVRSSRWRDLGRAEAHVVGVQYRGWNEGRFGNRPYVVVGERRAPWLFRGTGLGNGSRFGVYGIEIDGRTAESPPGTRVLARIGNAFGRGRSAEMTYYETRRDAKVFAAGALNFGGSALWPTTWRLLENLWQRLARP